MTLVLLILAVPFALSLFAWRRPYVVAPAVVLAWWLLPGWVVRWYLATLAVGTVMHLWWGFQRIARRRRQVVAVVAGNPAETSPGVLPMYTSGAKLRHQVAAPIHRVTTVDEQMSKYVTTQSAAIGPARGGAR